MLDFAAQTAALAAAGPLPLVVGGLAAAGLASLVPPPPAGLREPVSVSLEGGKAPLNTHGVGRGGKFPPFQGKVLAIERMGGRDAERDVSRIVIETGGVLFHEGQSFGVVPPSQPCILGNAACRTARIPFSQQGTKINSKGQEVPETVRLYSIASSRYGDRHDGKTCTLCVVRVVWRDEEGKVHRGVCSNYLCDLKVGDTIQMTGPSGTAMLLPDDHMQRRIVCVATGTGIAPFRAFWRRLFCDQVPGHPHGYQGRFWLLAGFANPDSELFTEELRTIQAANPDRFRLDVALSLTQTNKRGGPEYVQDRIEESGEEFLALLASDDALFYFCGLKRMYTSVMEVVERLGAERGIDTKALITKLKKEHRWHVETA
ncbi:hypothetical protein COHA_000902 [Chlorella ohadii]|uniref:ferredoxin--NADP(+) reductase n=1 Tax=Chlorella ohadii TaxID=2649997 RepID=A0AAD5H6E8_9CHLO|nr:hypothetical protein COHA_000902 [Chlorella ohadii]